MENKKLQNLCRICLSQSDQMIPLDATFNRKSTSVAYILEKLMSVKLIQTAQYPNQVCLNCKKRLRISYNLHVLFHKSQDLLNEWTKVEKYLDQTCHLNNPMIFEEEQGHRENCEQHITLESSTVSDQISNNNDEPTQTEKESETLDHTFEEIKIVVIDDSQDSDETGISHNEIETDISLDEIMNQLHSANSPEIDKIEALDDDKCFVKHELASIENVKLDHSYDDEFHLPTTDCGSETKTRPEPEITAGASGESAGNDQLHGNLVDKMIKQSKSRMKLKNSENPATVRTKTPQRKAYICESCGNQSQNQPWGSTTCTVCNAENSIKRLKCCQQCDFTTQCRNKMVAHRFLHSGPRFKCDLCAKAYTGRAGLMAHKAKHDNIHNYLCTVCGKTFGYESGLMYHMRIVHNNERRFCCTYCGQKFQVHSHLKRHETKHSGNRPYQCSECGKSFISLGELKAHQEKVHTLFKPLKCEYCNKRFRTRYNIKVHHMTHTGDHACIFCSKTFIDVNVLQLHMNFKHKTELQSQDVKDVFEQDVKDVLEVLQ